MDENAEKNATRPPVLSVQILLPENVDNRLEAWTESIPGASWPQWGGHITLVPHFTSRIPIEELLEIIAAACANEPPFDLKFGLPVAMQDLTRPRYYIVLLSVGELSHGGESLPEVLSWDGVEELLNREDAREDPECERLCALRARLLDALQDVREDLYPQLVSKPFRPHVTLAFALGESEAQQVVHQMRTGPVEGNFMIEVVWLMVHGEGAPSQFARYPIQLGRAVTQQADK